jgi:hypothetical protein
LRRELLSEWADARSVARELLNERADARHHGEQTPRLNGTAKRSEQTPFIIKPNE